jgi:hypothetical protein
VILKPKIELVLPYMVLDLVYKFQIICGPSWSWRKTEYLEKTIDLSQVTDKLYHIPVMLINLILYLFHEDYIQPEATSSSPQHR